MFGFIEIWKEGVEAQMEPPLWPWAKLGSHHRCSGGFRTGPEVRWYRAAAGSRHRAGSSSAWWWSRRWELSAVGRHRNRVYSSLAHVLVPLFPWLQEHQQHLLCLREGLGAGTTVIKGYGKGGKHHNLAAPVKGGLGLGSASNMTCLGLFLNWNFLEA